MLLYGLQWLALSRRRGFCMSLTRRQWLPTLASPRIFPAVAQVAVLTTAGPARSSPHVHRSTNLSWPPCEQVSSAESHSALLRASRIITFHRSCSSVFVYPNYIQYLKFEPSSDPGSRLYVGQISLTDREPCTASTYLFDNVRGTRQRGAVSFQCRAARRSVVR